MQMTFSLDGVIATTTEIDYIRPAPALRGDELCYAS